MARFKTQYRCTPKRLPMVGDVVVWEERLGKSRWVVVEARNPDSAERFSPRAGWKVTLRKLYQDSYTYNPRGRLAGFVIGSGFLDCIEPSELLVVGKMQQTFVACT